ncbi:MAG: RrF2 family transcriptional regulator [Christensenellaceae bacterium]|jgi:Rrf2 family iron-sulfur cluster assembly transcriptional regulator
MKLSTKGRYGLRAMIDIALTGEEAPVSISSVAGRQNISESYLEQLVGKLKKNGLLKSARGAGGGYTLARRTDEISVGDILRALEGDLSPVDCPGLDDDSEGCSGADSCVTKYVWKRINDSINKTVDEIMLDTLIRESREKNSDNVCEHKGA